MKIEYLGHACFKINDSLVIDPYKDGSVPGLAPLRTSAAKVICSHGHADHSGVECVEINPTLSCDLKIEEIASWHDDQQGALRGPNTIFVITSAAAPKTIIPMHYRTEIYGYPQLSSVEVFEKIAKASRLKGTIDIYAFNGQQNRYN